MSQQYIGNELEVFEHAHNWKGYYRRMIQPYLKGDVLEVGAGLGGTTKSLCDGTQQSWICLEPDNQLCEKIREKLSSGQLPPVCKMVNGTIESLPAQDRFDAILYMDVIEHIEDDAAEMKRAAARLKPGGVLIILVPAHQWLYSPFDKAIGHFRRYSRKRLAQAIPAELKRIFMRNLDSSGMMASTANKMFLKQSMPTAKQIAFWDKRIVPVSRVTDKLTFHRFGKSILGVWQKQGA